MRIAMAKSQKKMSEALDEYVAAMRARQRSPETVRVDLAMIGKFIRIVGDKQLASLRVSHIEQYFYGPKGLMTEHETGQWGRSTNPGLSPASHNQHRNRLKVWLEWCAKRGYLPLKVPTEAFDKTYGVVRPLKVPKRPRQQPPPHVLLSLLDHAKNPRDRAFIATSINTALRANEIKRITVGNVDLEAGYLSVIISKTGEVDNQPISSDLDAELRRWLTVYTEDLGRPPAHDDFLFPSRKGNLISHYDVDEEGNRFPVRTPYEWIPEKMMGRTEEIVKHALKSAGLPTRYEGTHTLRRAVALAYFEAAAQEQGDVAALRETAALLHHGSLATTERYLGKTAEKQKRDRRMKGQPFLTAMVSQENVVQLRRAAEGE